METKKQEMSQEAIDNVIQGLTPGQKVSFFCDSDLRAYLTVSELKKTPTGRITRVMFMTDDFLYQDTHFGSRWRFFSKSQNHLIVEIEALR